MEFGSFTNVMMSGNAPFEPEIGMGATMLYWTDRKACTITAIEHFKTGARAGQVKAVWVKQDIATRTDNWGMSDSQSYEYAPNPTAPRIKFSKRKDGSFKDEGGTRLRIGSREQYFDYSF